MPTQDDDAGYRYVMARTANGPGRGVLTDIGRHGATGNMPLEGEARRTLDELIYRRVDGHPAYTPSDVTRAASEVYERHLRQLASQAAAALGRRGRAVNSEAQQDAARANGAKGGAPRVTHYACSECGNAIARGEPGWEDWSCPEHPGATVDSIRA